MLTSQREWSDLALVMRAQKRYSQQAIVAEMLKRHGALSRQDLVFGAHIPNYADVIMRCRRKYGMEIVTGKDPENPKQPLYRLRNDGTEAQSNLPI